MKRRQPRSTRTDKLIHETTLFRSHRLGQGGGDRIRQTRPRHGRGGIPARRRRARTHPQCHRQRSEEHTSELQSLMRISYAVFCLKQYLFFFFFFSLFFFLFSFFFSSFFFFFLSLISIFLFFF